MDLVLDKPCLVKGVDGVWGLVLGLDVCHRIYIQHWSRITTAAGFKINQLGSSLFSL